MKKLICYHLTRDGSPGAYIIGPTPEKIAQAIADEFRENEGLALDEIPNYHLTPCEFTQKELDAMGEFDGW